MGRVNSLKQLRYARDIGCASADGTFITFAPDTNLRRCLDTLDEDPRCGGLSLWPTSGAKLFPK
jgi:hypothetical protein